MSRMAGLDYAVMCNLIIHTHTHGYMQFNEHTHIHTHTKYL